MERGAQNGRDGSTRRRVESGNGAGSQPKGRREQKVPARRARTQ